MGWDLSGAWLPAYHWGQVKCEASDKFQENCSKANTPFCWGWTLWAPGWSEPPQIKFYQANPPRGATFVCWPLPNSQRIYPHLVGWTLRAQGKGEPPENKILPGKCTPKSNFCLLAPAQFLTLQGISDGVSMGCTPGGWHFGSSPGSMPSPGEMRSPCQISGGWVVWARRQAAGHTHTHTLSSLYIRFGNIYG
jgi:hypothetical protein